MLKMQAWLKTALFVLITAILTRLIPFSAFFRNVYTLIHEMSHTVVTLLLSGRVMFIFLYADQSGVTHSVFTENWMSIPIALAGYPGAALFALLLFRLLGSGRERTGLILVAVIALLGFALFIRNVYGMAWCTGFAAVTIAIGLLAPRWLRIVYAALVAFICLVESVISSLTILTLSIVEPRAAGDAANLAAATAVPAFVWGLLFAGFTLWCAKSAISVLLRSALGRQNH